MARVKIEKVISKLESEMRNALTEAVQSVLPGAYFDPYELFRQFQRAVGRKCSTWERVPDTCIDPD